MNCIATFAADKNNMIEIVQPVNNHLNVGASLMEIYFRDHYSKP